MWIALLQTFFGTFNTPTAGQAMNAHAKQIQHSRLMFCSTPILCHSNLNAVFPSTNAIFLRGFLGAKFTLQFCGILQLRASLSADAGILLVTPGKEED